MRPRSAGSLWDKALDALDDEDKCIIKSNSNDKLSILKEVLTAVEEKKRICLDKRWRYKEGKREIIIRDQLEKIAGWVKQFINVGNSIMQYDPGHAALPWAGVHFLLQVRFYYYG